MRILLLRTWLQNIGNGFIDKGAKMIIQNSIPGAEIVEASCYPNIVADRQRLGELAGLSKLFGNFSSQVRKSRIADFIRERQTQRAAAGEEFAHVGELVDADIAVLPGCVLYREALSPIIKTLERLSKRGIPIVFLGAGGGDYSSKTQTYVRKQLQNINEFAIITRDKEAYTSYSEITECVRDGIDCAFFIDEWHNPVEANKEFVTYTFDKIEEPQYKGSKQVIRPTHNPFGHSVPFDSLLSNAVQARKRKKEYEKSGFFVSDNLEDYLFLYKNTHETHTDRIHACIPTLVYGNTARFYFDTPRAQLFEKISQAIEGDPAKESISLDRSRLRDFKKDQIAHFKQAVRMLVDT